MFQQIGGDASDRFALREDPDGVYRVDGRVIPVRDEAAVRDDNGEPVVGVQRLSDMGVGRLGREAGVNVEQCPVSAASNVSRA